MPVFTEKFLIEILGLQLSGEVIMVSLNRCNLTAILIKIHVNPRRYK
jgi:hypothetical protein